MRWMPEHLREEQDLLVDEWWNEADEGVDIYDYVMSRCSDELREFVLEAAKRKAEYEKRGIIID